MTKKSIQKSKKGRQIDVSAGGSGPVSTNCPADMTDAVKRDLEREIEAFKQDPDAEAIVWKEAETSAAGGPAVSAYDKWLAEHGGDEVPAANPDVVADEDGLKYTKSETDGKLASLLTEFRESLTPRQRQVWNLVMKHNMGMGNAAKLLGLSRGTVQDYLSQAKVKFKAFAEAIKDARAIRTDDKD